MKALIMAGGQGTRFWPMSLEERPKQFLRITGTRTLFQETVERLSPLLDLADIYVVCSERYADLVYQQVPELTREQVIIEPAARNTAACIGFATNYLKSLFADEVVAVLPADHLIQDKLSFHRALEAAEVLARENWLVTFGIEPDHPSTGYGYLERGAVIQDRGGEHCPAYRVARFAEKPDLETAKSFLESGRYSWNSGMFVWSIQSILNQMERHMPRLFSTLSEIEREGRDTLSAKALFEQCEKISIDYGVMEKTDRAAVIPCSIGWSDVGSWAAVRGVRRADPDGIVSEGETITVDSQNCIIYSGSGKLVSLVGVENLVIVETEHALLVCAEDRSQDVKQVVEKLKEKRLDRYL